MGENPFFWQKERVSPTKGKKKGFPPTKGKKKGFPPQKRSILLAARVEGILLIVDEDIDLLDRLFGCLILIEIDENG